MNLHSYDEDELMQAWKECRLWLSSILEMNPDLSDLYLPWLEEAWDQVVDHPDN